MRFIGQSASPALQRIACIALILALSACGGGGSSDSENTAGTSEPGQPSTTTQSGNDPSPADSTSADAHPYQGIITLDDYDWFGVNSYLGVVDITLEPLAKKRLLDGSMPRRHSSGDVVYRQPCGDRVHRVMQANQAGLSTQITPCSSEIPNPGFSPTDFEFSALSPDGQQVAAEVRYYLDGRWEYDVMVFDVASQATIARVSQAHAPLWLRSGRLLVSGNDGFFLLDNQYDNPAPISDQLIGFVNNPALHPTQDLLAFEFNQQIWLMNTDGTNAREAVYGAARLRYPTWSPDGDSLAYLATDSSDRYHRNLYFTHLPSGQSYALDLRPVLDPINSSNVPNGPLSWRP